MGGNPSQRQLRKQDSIARRFFRNFQYQHNIAHEDLLSIQSICNTLTDALTGFSAPNYGSGQTAAQTKSQVADFLTAFYPMRLEAVQSITHLRYYVDVLLNLADDFRSGNNLVCSTNSTLSGDAAELNQLNCDLNTFFDGLTGAGVGAKQLLDSLLGACDVLGKLARDFDFANNASNGSSSGSDSTDANFLPNFNAFVAEFVTAHDAAHVNLVNLGNICDLLTQSINDWLARL